MKALTPVTKSMGPVIPGTKLRKATVMAVTSTAIRKEIHRGDSSIRFEL